MRKLVIVVLAVAVAVSLAAPVFAEVSCAKPAAKPCGTCPKPCGDSIFQQAANAINCIEAPSVCPKPCAKPACGTCKK